MLVASAPGRARAFRSSRHALARRLLASCALAILAAPGHAQDVAPASDDGEQAEILVTARQRSERLQDVPVAITAVSGARLTEAGISQLVQLQFEAPSVSIAIANPRQTSVAIRGLGNNPASDGLSSSVGIYLDGVYLDRPGMGTFDLADVERIEVLRGPQGTLFGKNTTAGALSVTTRAPSFTPELSGQASFGNLDYRQVQLSASGPISDTLAVRLSGYVTSRDGYLRNVLLGGNELSLRRHGVRGQVLFKPSDAFSWRLIGEYGREDDRTGAFVLYNAGPASSANARFVPYDRWAANLGLAPIRDPYSLTTDLSRHQRQLQKQFAFTSIVDAAIGTHRLTSVTGYRDWDFNPYNDFDWSRANVIAQQGVFNHDKQFSQELRLASPTDGPIDYVIGAYYFHRRMASESITVYGSDYSRGLGAIGNPALNNATTRTAYAPVIDSYALFAQGTWHISPRFDLTVGGRGTYERAKNSIQRFALTGGTGTPPASLAPFAGAIAIKDTTPSALGTLSYKPSRDVLLYATLSYGAKAGGFNTNVPQSTTGAALPISSLRVGPEKARNIEFGLKSSLFDRRVTLNLSAFRTDVSDYQANTIVQNSTGFQSLITNVGKVRAQGIEVEATARPIAGLRIGVSTAYNDTYYRSFRNAPAVQGSVAATQDLSGRPVVYAPKWNVNLNAQYERPISNKVIAYVGGDYSYKSKFYGYIDDSDYARVPSYALANVRAGVRLDGGRWDIYAWGRNVFDKRYFFQVIPASTGSGGYFGAPSEPETYGATVAVKF